MQSLEIVYLFSTVSGKRRFRTMLKVQLQIHRTLIYIYYYLYNNLLII